MRGARWRSSEGTRTKSGERAPRALCAAQRPERRVGGFRRRYSRRGTTLRSRNRRDSDPLQQEQEAPLRSTSRARRTSRSGPRKPTAATSCAPTLGKSAEDWRTYIGLTQIEDTFRITKHDLGCVPSFTKKERIQAHILVCFLSLVLWRTLQQWMSHSGSGSAPRKLLEEMAEVRSLDVVLPPPRANCACAPSAAPTPPGHPAPTPRPPPAQPPKTNPKS